MTEIYRFLLEGPLSPELASTFHPIHSTTAADSTELICSIDDKPELFGLVSRFEILGLTLISMNRTRPDDWQ